MFFIKNKNNFSSKFYNINQYFPLEEIKEPIEKVKSILENIIFYNSDHFLETKLITGNIKATGNNYIIKSKDIKINDMRLKYDLSNYITTIQSSKLEIKILFKIIFRL